MNKKTTIIIVIVAVVALIAIIAGFLIGTYNGIAVAREKVDTAESQIDTALQRRADLVPNLVSAVKSLNEHEETVVKAVTDARAAITGAQTTEDKLAANEQLTTAINLIFENYPEIQSADAYRDLMTQLEGTENRIATARKDHNDAIRAYNSKIITFPGNLFANIFGFEKAEYFEASDGADTAPNVGELFG